MHPTLLSLGPFSLSTYGVLSAAGYAAAIHWLSKRREAMGLSEDRFWTLVYWLFGGILLGAKLAYVLVERDLTLLWRDPRYGFVFYGGVFGCVAAGFIARRRMGGFDLRAVADHFAAAMPLGHAIGRLGCLGAGCCYGRHTGLPWGLPMAGDPSRHPVQLYEAGFNLALFAFAGYYLLPRRLPVLRVVLVAYAAARFLLEFLRDDARGAGLFGLSPSQVAALLAIVLAALWRPK